MNWQFDDLDILNFDDPMKLKAALSARRQAQLDVQRENDRIETERRQASELALQKREQIEASRYLENRRLSLIAIWIAAVTGSLSLLVSGHG